MTRSEIDWPSIVDRQRAERAAHPGMLLRYGNHPVLPADIVELIEAAEGMDEFGRPIHLAAGQVGMVFCPETGGYQVYFDNDASAVVMPDKLLVLTPPLNENRHQH
jgi:hypothetical protein